VRVRREAFSEKPIPRAVAPQEGEPEVQRAADSGRAEESREFLRPFHAGFNLFLIPKPPSRRVAGWQTRLAGCDGCKIFIFVIRLERTPPKKEGEGGEEFFSVKGANGQHFT